MTPETQKKIVDALQLSGGLLEASMAKLASYTGQEEKVAAAAPNVADLLIKNAFVPEHLRDQAIATLRNPVMALEVLHNVITKIAAERAGQLGKPVDATEKNAAANDNYIGRKGGSLRPSDLRWLERMNVR